jgi:hypothetical protein
LESKVCGIRRNSSGVITHRRFYDRLQNAVIRREGSRASDNMRFSVDGTCKIQERDEVYYIQDIVSVDNLTSIHNFYGNFRDESGYEHDDYYTGNYSMPACVAGTTHTEMGAQTGKWKGLYKPRLDVSSTTDGIKMHRRFKEQSNSNPPIIDLSGDFDIYLALKFNNVTQTQYKTPTLIDLYDSTSSKGLRLEYDHDNTDVKITINNGSGSDNICVIDYTFSTNTNYLIRVGRKGGVIKCSINNQEQTVSNSSYTGDLNNNNAYWYLGKKFTSSWVNNTGFSGWFQQLRTYNKYLSSDDAFKIFASKPQALTMKFGGKIWKITSGHNKRYEAKSHSAEILGTILSVKNLTATPSNSNVTRDGTIYSDGAVQEIITDILENIGNDEFVHFTKEPDSDPVTYQYANIVATGTFLQVIETLMMLEASSTTPTSQFYWNILPRKVLIVENFLPSNYVIDESHFRVIDNYYDDTKTTNKVFVIGDLSSKKGVHTVTRSTSGWSVFAPVMSGGSHDVIVDYVIKATADGTEINEYSGSGTPSTNEYEFNDNKTKVRFYGTSGSSVSYKLEYIYKSNASTSSAYPTFVEKSDATSMNENGVYSRRLNLSNIQIKTGQQGSTTFNTFADNYIKQHKDIPLRVKLETPTIINALNIGQLVQVSYITKNIYSSYNSSTKAVTPLQMKVKSIEWRYPEAKTTIELGEHEWNSFDVEKETVQSVQGLDLTTRAIVGV